MAYVALFGAGVVGFLSPCVLPLVPTWLLVLSGSGSRRSIGGVVQFCIGFAASLVMLGAVVGAVGWTVTATSATVQRWAGVVLVVMGASILVGDRLGLARWWRPVDAERVAGPLRAVLLGVAAGAAWTPCVGPLLGAALVVAGTGGSPTRGAALLGAYAAGTAVPLIVVAAIADRIPRIGQRAQRVGAGLHRASGAALIVVGILFAVGAYADVISRLVPVAAAVSG